MLRTDLKKHICGRTAGLSLQRAFSAPRGASRVGDARAADQVRGRNGLQHGRPGLGEVPVHPGYHSKATGVVLDRADRACTSARSSPPRSSRPPPADPSQRWLFLLLPVVFVVILYRYPAGLLVYWITTNLWTIGQQSLIRRRLPPPERPPKHHQREAEHDRCAGGRRRGRWRRGGGHGEGRGGGAGAASTARAAGAAPTAAPQEEETVGQATMSEAKDRDGTCQTTSSSRRGARGAAGGGRRWPGLDVDVEVVEAGRRPRRAARRRGRGTADRQARADDRRRPAPRAAHRLSRRPIVRARGDRRQRLPRPPRSRPCGRRRTTLPTRRSAPGSRSSWTHCRRSSGGSCTSTCAIVATSRPTARATSRSAISS